MEATNVTMLPVCNCGQIIPDISIEMNVIKLENGLNKALIEFHPAVCPNCGKHIERLQVDNKYVELFKKGV